MPLFDKIAERYERYAEINDQVYRPYLRQALPEGAGSGLDLGCGSGRFTGLLADRCETVLAVDIAERELQIAKAKRARGNIEYRPASVLDLDPVVDGRFDIVISVNTLFHLYAEHPPDRVLEHVRSLVAPGGTAVVIDVVVPRRGSPLTHRWWGIGEAARTLRRRRSVPDALTVLRLRQHRVWMEHTRQNHPMTPAEFEGAYGSWFPGAELSDALDPFIRAMTWHAPAEPA